MKKLLLFLTVFCLVGVYTSSAIAEGVKDPNQLFRRGGGNNSEEESSSDNNLVFSMTTCNSSLNAVRQMSLVCKDMEILYGYRIPYGCTQFPSNQEKSAIENIVNNFADYLAGSGVNVSTEFIDGDLLALSNPNAQQEQLGVGLDEESVEEEDNDSSRRFGIVGIVRNTIRGGINIIRNILPGGRGKNTKADDEIFYDYEEYYADFGKGNVDNDNESDSQNELVVQIEEQPLLSEVNDNSSEVEQEQLDNSSVSVSEGDIVIVDTSVSDDMPNITDENFCEIQKEEFNKLPRSCVELQFAFHCKSPELTPVENNYFFNSVIDFTRLFNYKYTVTTLLFKRASDEPEENNVENEENNNVEENIDWNDISTISDDNADINNPARNHISI